ncbi:hypothetical protein Clacol_009747 [Clathrus columnatus]|uniref:Trehalase n=1 Tax=Clathrus columnatus TaxID=1419009 RepID=A0AAV5AQN5_9AGAM|nr:hypothetical protein Clacol_009747 [Clathrus columnatus]
MSAATRLLFTALALSGLDVTSAAVSSAARKPPSSSTTRLPIPTSVSLTTSEIVTISTSVPSPTEPLNSLVPSEAPLPPNQAWCPSEVFCAGALIQAVDLAQLFVDSKTFVDKPTSGTVNKTLADFNALAVNGVNNITIGAIEQFVETDFQGEGLELEATPLPGFTTTPAFLKNVTDPLVKDWTQVVHSFWVDLVRSTNASTLCTPGKCENYWDSYFIIEGLIKSELFTIANNTLQNFMDEIVLFGFIPNGGRIYYLNRSQPPLFTHMLFNYVQASGDTSILERALPLVEVELEWWQSNRTFNITSPFTNITRSISHYAVNINSAPRPESYLEDYQTVHGAGTGDITPNFTLQEQADLYAELASGAETDGARVQLADLYEMTATTTVQGPHGKPVTTTNQTALERASFHRAIASDLKSAILDLFWDPEKLAFYDFNLTSNARNSLWSAATFYPFWNGIYPTEVLSNWENAFGAFSAVNMVLNKFNGTVPVTFFVTGLQWDAPNTWPPHQYIILQALKNLPSNLTSMPLPEPLSFQTTFDLVPDGQIGVSISQLPQQFMSGGSPFPVGADVNSIDSGLTIVNGGNATKREGWAETLQRELSNRYIASAFCNWVATGGSIPGVVDRLPDDQLNITLSLNNTGIMFEKFSLTDVDESGAGGEYTVQAGFGWTNGVTLWIAGEYGQILTEPFCPRLVNTTAPVP